MKRGFKALQAYKNQTKDQSNPLGRCPEQKNGKEHGKVRIMKGSINNVQSVKATSVRVMALKVEEYLYSTAFLPH